MTSRISLSEAPVFITIIMSVSFRWTPLGGDCHSGQRPFQGGLGPGMIDGVVSKLAQPFFSPHLGLFGPGQVDLLRSLRRLDQDNRLVWANLGISPAHSQKSLLPPSCIGQLPNLERRHKRGVTGPDAEIPRSEERRVGKEC